MHTPLSICQRPINTAIQQQALELGLSPLLARLLAARLKQEKPLQEIVQPSLQDLHPPHLLKDAEKAAKRLAQAIQKHERIGILTDYDVDGITSHALIQEALSKYFHVADEQLAHYIGHRIEDGYGISSKLCQRILDDPEQVQLIITADCGSSDEHSIGRLHAAGIDVIVSDHHAIPTTGIPSKAYAVINPSRSDCNYPDKFIAGCMVAWLLMCQCRIQLLAEQLLDANTEKLGGLLDYVALGTVADCVSMGESAANRAVVTYGLQGMNQERRPCWQAMAQRLKNHHYFDAETLAFQLGPRINARSRMSDPFAALHFLQADNIEQAKHALDILDLDNQMRRETEQKMVQEARQLAKQQRDKGHRVLCIWLQEGHAGVQGIVASRLIERFGHPCIVFCPAQDPDLASGSARSVDGLHIKHLLDAVAAEHPQLFTRYGGHAGAAGMTLARQHIKQLQIALEQQLEAFIDPQKLKPVLWTDGGLDKHERNLETLEKINQLQPFGRGFEAPIFHNRFTIKSIRMLGKPAIHAAIELSDAQQSLRGIWFSALEDEEQTLPFHIQQKVQCSYQLNENHFRDKVSLQLLIRHLQDDNDAESIQAC